MKCKTVILKSFACLTMAVYLLSGCSDSDVPQGDNCEPDVGISGQTIKFGVKNVESRTFYEERYQINWLSGDKVGIFSGGVATADGQHNAVYKINEVDADGHKYHATLAAEGGGLLWGNDLTTPCTFYGAYPADRIKAYPDNNNFSMQYWTNQSCRVTYRDDDAYLTEPDMANAYMMAKNSVVPNGNHILLAFDPIMTTLDIKVTAGSYEVATGIIQPVTITGVSITMPKKMNNENLNYVFDGVTNGDAALHGHLDDTRVTSDWEAVFVGIDNAGKKYIDLFEGESINLMAFLPPFPDLAGAKVRVHVVGGFDYVVTCEETLEKQSRIDIKLPDVSPNTAKPNNWISMLDDDMPIKQMSIPAYVCTENTTADNIKTLLNKGVRGFDFHELLHYNAVPVYHYLLTEIEQVMYDFLQENKGEFILAWVYNEDTNFDDGLDKGILEGCWSGFVEKIGAAKGKVIAIEKHLNKFRPLDDTGALDKNILFPHDDISSIDLSVDNGEKGWKAQLIESADNNEGIYNQIVQSPNSNFQTGCLGLVSIPNAGEILNCGDLLLQAIIDCNFKFRSDF